MDPGLWGPRKVILCGVPLRHGDASPTRCGDRRREPDVRRRRPRSAGPATDGGGHEQYRHHPEAYRQAPRGDGRDDHIVGGGTRKGWPARSTYRRPRARRRGGSPPGSARRSPSMHDQQLSAGDRLPSGPARSRDAGRGDCEDMQRLRCTSLGWITADARREATRATNENAAPKGGVFVGIWLVAGTRFHLNLRRARGTPVDPSDLSRNVLFRRLFTAAA